MTSEVSVESCFPDLARQWNVEEAVIQAYWRDLTGAERFLDAINHAIRDVPDFAGVQFDHVSRMRTFRCLLYLCTRVLRPEVFVETGVQNGMSSAFILLGMEHNRLGKLYSIDLPPVDQRILEQGTRPLPQAKAPGWIIPDFLRPRHDLRLGAAETLLPGLLTDLGRTDVFLHDSDHSYSHVMFEIGLAWRYLKSGGWIIVDNIEQNSAFADFARDVDARSFIVSTFKGSDRTWQHGLLHKHVS